jgi:transposase
MLIVGYVFAIRSERALCRDVRVNLAYRWFCGLSIEDKACLQCRETKLSRS